MILIPAKGLRGHLLDSFNGTYTFRMYDGQHGFKDYTLRHCDLTIIIDDDDAVLYEDTNGNMKLDHNPQTLGINTDELKD